MAELVDATDSKSVELRFMSVRVGLGVPPMIITDFCIKFFLKKNYIYQSNFCDFLKTS